MSDEKPRIVCLCGSTRFKEAFDDANYQETMAGNIVLSVGFYMHASGNRHGGSVGCDDQQKIALDILHKRKIDLADEILVLNVGGYIGDSTKSEIAYARSHQKPIRWLDGSCIPSGYGAEGIADSKQDANLPVQRVPEPVHDDSTVPAVLRVDAAPHGEASDTPVSDAAESEFLGGRQRTWLEVAAKSRQVFRTMRALERRLKEIQRQWERDMPAYRGALGYPVPDWHDGKLCNGTTPVNGLAESVVNLRAIPAEAELARLRSQQEVAPGTSTPEMDQFYRECWTIYRNDGARFLATFDRACALEKRLREAQLERDAAIISRDYARGARDFQQDRADVVLREAEENKMDAERYRWLRDDRNEKVRLLSQYAGNTLDEKVDAALAEKGKV